MITDFYSSANPILENKSGICTFQFACADAVEFIPPACNGEIKESVIFKSGAWLNGYATDETLLYRDDVEFGTIGTLHPIALNGFVPKVSIENTLNFKQMSCCPGFIVKWTDRNGIARIAGTIKHPLLFAYKEAIEPNHGSTNGYAFGFSRTYKCPAPFYNPV